MQKLYHAVTLHPVQLHFMSRDAILELSAGTHRLYHDISTPPVAAAHALPRHGAATQAI
jgi:hypothetical protein